MSLFKRGPYWHYEFMVAGKRYRGSTKETTRAKADKVKARKIMEAESGTAGIKRVPTLKEIKPRFFTWVENSRLKDHSKRYYKEGWKVLEKTNLPSLRLTGISSDEVDAAKLPGSSAFVNQAIRTLRRMLGKAQEWKLIPLAPRLKLAEEHGREAIISGEQEAALLQHMTPKFRVAYLMMKDGGMRRDEVARASIERIDWTNKVYFNEYGKTRKARRYVLLSTRLYEALFVYVGARKEGWLFPAKKSKKTGHVHPDTLTHWFQEARVEAKLPEDIVLYSARHTFGTVLYQRTGNLKLVMDLMGHTNTETAMKYQHPAMELGRVAIDNYNAETGSRVQ